MLLGRLLRAIPGYCYRSLSALLYVSPHEVFCISFQYIIDLVEQIVRIGSQLFTSLLAGCLGIWCVIVPATTVTGDLFLRHSQSSRYRKRSAAAGRADGS